MSTDRFFLKCNNFTLIYDGLEKFGLKVIPSVQGQKYAWLIGRGWGIGFDKNKVSEPFYRSVINI